VIQDVAMQCGASKALVNDRMNGYALPKFRCEPIASPFPMTIINDSKATNPSATLAAINSTPGDKVLILSGEPKFDYDADWMREILSNCTAVYATGGLSQNRHVFPEEFWPQLVFYAYLKDAVMDALKRAEGGTLLFSPSAASFDEFSNYMERGHAFNAYINHAI
jgi:UDP-N-acetylmuramoylalanine--D-glutamate ligase